MGFPVICSSLPTRVDLSRYSHLDGLELVENVDTDKGEIDIFVRSDFYWSIVTEGLRICDKGPIAVNSKLGWLLSGPVHNSTMMKSTVTNLILTDTDVSNPTHDDVLLTC